MKTDIDIKDDVYQYIKGTVIPLEITGSVYKSARPSNSTLEDVTIAILANNLAQNQTAYVNVNVFVADKDMKFKSDGVVTATKIENDKRLRSLCKMCADVFEVYHQKAFRLTLVEQRVYQNNGTAEHFINNKLLYQYNIE